MIVLYFPAESPPLKPSGRSRNMRSSALSCRVRDGRDSHQQDAYATAEWLRRSGLDGTLQRFFSPSLTDHERHVAEMEGWILGIA